MSGLNGIFSKNTIANPDERMGAMNNAIANRGRDDGSILKVCDKLILGFRKQAITQQDQQSKQPLVSDSGRFALIFDGRMVNRQEIRNELKETTLSKDPEEAELVLASCETKGIDWLLEKANGSYAFALYDYFEQMLFLARGRSGMKPLYYDMEEGTLIFSSEAKGILSSGLMEPEFNYRAIDEYLAGRYIRPPFTFFENIKQVGAGCYLTINDNMEVDNHPYWDLPALNFETEYEENKIYAETASTLEEAIKRWSVANASVGTYLSGGVDSSLTTAILAHEASDRINTYTIGFKEEGFNEFKYSKMVADRYHTRHHQWFIDEADYISEWQKMIEFKDAPLAVPNEIPLAIMTKRLSNDVSFVVSGEGSDELFGGYSRLFRSPFDFENNKIGGDYYDYFIGLYEYVSREIRDKYLIGNKNYRAHFDNLIKEDFKKHKNEENVFRFISKHHAPGLLNRIDNVAAIAGVEVRPPFIDKVLIEFAFSKIPYSLKLKWKSEEAKNKAKTMYASEYSEVLDIPKYILKKVAEKYLPHEVIYRKKMGFPVPLSHWFPNLENMAKEYLTATDWLENQAVDELCKALKDNPKGRSGQLLWMFLNIEIFKQKYFNKKYKW